MPHIRLYLTCLLLALPVAPAMADRDFWRNVVSSGATTASTYATSNDDKLLLAAREEAGAYVASGGAIHGAYLEAALQRLRRQHPQLQASDAQLAQALLAADPEQMPD